MGTFPFRFSPETRKLFQEHGDYFSGLDSALKESNLSLFVGDPEARTEFDVLPTGELSVTFVYPVDDNRDPADGRLYVKDRFLFRGPEEKIRQFNRDFELKGGDPAVWQSRLQQFQKLDLPERDQILAFARDVARSFARPFSEDILSVLRGQGDYLSQAAQPFLDKFPNWKFRIKDPQNHFVLIPRGDRLEIQVYLVVDDNKNPPDGRIFLMERFLVTSSGRLVDHGRSFSVAPEVKGDLRDELKEAVAGFNRRVEFGEEDASNFLREILPPLLKAPETTFTPGEYLDYFVNEGKPDWKIPNSASSLGAMAGEVRARRVTQEAAGVEAKRILAQLEKERGPLPPDHPLKKYLEQIAAEIDPKMRPHLYLHLARALWKDHHLPQTAYFLAQRLETDPEVQAKAKGLLSEMRGEAGFGQQFEAAIGHFSEDSVAPILLLGMFGAALGGTFAESLALRGLGGAGKGGRWVAGMIGLGGEAATLTAVQRMALPGGEGTGSQLLLSNLLLFSAIRLAHNGAGWTTARMGEGRWGTRWGGVLADRTGNPILLSPMGRATLGEWGFAMNGPTAQLTRSGKFLSEVLYHGGAVAAMAGSHAVAKEAGWLPGTTQGAFSEGALALFSYLHGLAGFRLANQMSGGSLVEFLTQARLRMTGLEKESPKGPSVPLPTPAPVPPWKRMEAIGTKDLPDLRIYEAGKTEDFAFHFPEKGSVYLDPILFLRKEEKLEIKRDTEGQIFLRDHRDLWAPPGPDSQPRPIDLITMPILLNRNPVPAGEDVAIQVGDELNFAGRKFRFSFPKKSPLGLALSMASRDVQLNVAEVMDRAEDLSELLRELHAGKFEGSEALHAQVSEVLSGRQLIYQLPSEWGIFPKIQTLLDREIEGLEREGYPPSEFVLKGGVQNPRWSETEKNYQSARALKDWREKLSKSQTPDELASLLEQSPFAEIEGQAVSQILHTLNEAVKSHFDFLVHLPIAGGFRQRTADLIEQMRHEAYWKGRQGGTLSYPQDPELRREFVRLDNTRSSLFQMVKRAAESEGTLQGLDAEELDGLVYQVLERGRPLALLPQAKNIRHDVEFFQTRMIRVAEKYFPQEMQETVNPFTGEKIQPGQKEALYRLALHTLNQKAGRLIFGPPSLGERQFFIDLIRRHLDPDLPEDFFQARRALRHQIDLVTTKASEMLQKAGLEEKAMILENYFGDSRIRELPPGVAFQVAALLGSAGMYREIGVTIEARGSQLRGVVSLGELHSVGKGDQNQFFLLHTHSEEYMTPDGKTMGMGGVGGGFFEGSGQRTLAMKPAKVNLENRNVLPSGEDVRIYLTQAKDFYELRSRSPIKLFSIPFYDSRSRTFKTWVVHPLGISETRIQLNEQGQARKLEVRYAFRRRDKHMDRSYLLQKEDLEKVGKELGIPTETKEMSFSDLVAELPFPSRFLL